MFIFSMIVFVGGRLGISFFVGLLLSEGNTRLSYLSYEGLLRLLNWRLKDACIRKYPNNFVILLAYSYLCQWNINYV